MKSAKHRCPTCNAATVPAQPRYATYTARDGATDRTTHHRRRCRNRKCGTTSVVLVMTRLGLPPRATSTPT